MKELEVEQAKRDKQREEDLKKKKEEEAKKKVEAALNKGNDLAADAEKNKKDGADKWAIALSQMARKKRRVLK